MRVLRTIKENLFFVLILLAYGVLMLVAPALGRESIKNAGYYVKEMLLIMPVIFVLTALLDLWVPKEKIMRYLGKEAKSKGLILSLVIGSISAGPIYAAFPMCVMLHKKGASIRNIIVILSSWAVIKVPMLLNEAKFLGPTFMAVRWVLTVFAIILFSWIAARMIKDTDLPHSEENDAEGITIRREACMGCRLCVEQHPALFEMQGAKAQVRADGDTQVDPAQLEEIIDLCPVQAIAGPTAHEKEDA